MKKICNQCRDNLPLDSFKINEHTGKHQVNCRKCAKKCAKKKREYEKRHPDEVIEMRKTYNEKNRKRINSYALKYYHKNKEKLKIKSSQYYYKHKEKRLKYAKEYEKKNRKRINERIRLYKHRNIEKTNAYARKIHKTQKYKDTRNKRLRWLWKHDLQFRIKRCLRTRMCQMMKGGIKSKSTIKLFGCSILELKKHLEGQFRPGMNWENHARLGWHIDHILPCDSFDLTKSKEQHKCFHYSNLQPLWATENFRKGNRII